MVALVAEIQPLAVSVSYLAAPDPGEVALSTVVRKRGRQVSHVDVELTQAGRVAVRAVVTLGRPDTDEPRHETPTSLASMAAEPPAETLAVAGDHPMASIVHVAKGCEMRIDASSASFLTGQQGEAEIRLWVRPFSGDEDDLDADDGLDALDLLDDLDMVCMPQYGRVRPLVTLYDDDSTNMMQHGHRTLCEPVLCASRATFRSRGRGRGPQLCRSRSRSRPRRCRRSSCRRGPGSRCASR